MGGLPVNWVPIGIALAAASVAAFTDVVEFRVRNSLTLPLILSGLIYHTVTGGTTGFAASFAGFAFGLGVLIVPWLMGLMAPATPSCWPE